MGCDTKTLCKALSGRLDKYLPQLIVDDQRGGFHDIRRVLNILHEKHNAKDTAMLSVVKHLIGWNGLIFLKYFQDSGLVKPF